MSETRDKKPPLHVYPLGDSFDHIVEGPIPCWCSPEHEQAEDGSDVIVHNSADDREKFEIGARKPS